MINPHDCKVTRYSAVVVPLEKNVPWPGGRKRNSFRAFVKDQITDEIMAACTHHHLTQRSATECSVQLLRNFLAKAVMQQGEVSGLSGL